MGPLARAPAPDLVAVSAAISAIWERHKDETLRRVAIIEDAVLALIIGELDAESRQQATRAAHKIAGSVGTFGFAEGSRIGRGLEHIFDAEDPPTQAQAPRLSELVLALRRELEAPAAAPGPAPAPSSAADGRPLLLLVDHEPDLTERLVAHATAARLRAVVATSPLAAREVLARERPDAVLLDPGFPDGTEDAMRLMSELGADSTPVPVLVFTARDAFTDRVEVARHGAAAFLDKSLPLPQVIEAVQRALARGNVERAKVLALDDDPAVLDAMTALLASTNLDLRTLEDPLQLFDALAQTPPDLLVLDFELPHANGLELCRALRSDLRWRYLPVLFLTGRTDADTVRRVFDAGADDYLTKPFVGPELIARIENRLERVRHLRQLADSDPLTAISNRSHSMQLLEQAARTADRFGQPLCLAVLDLDHFKQVNDRYGYRAGDAVLRSFGERLTNAFRGEDVVARWGGEEFVVGLYGLSKDDGVQRVGEFLEVFRGETFPGSNGTPFTLTFSAGVAQYPEDGAGVEALYRSADRALSQAKRTGRNRVLPAGERPPDGTVVDIVLVEDDEVLSSLVIHSLETRGYSVRWLTDGQAAADALACGLEPRLVLLDRDLPGLNGLDVLASMVESRLIDRTRVIMLTARSSEAEVLQALELGAIDHVAKPFSVPVLMQRIRRALGS